MKTFLGAARGRLFLLLLLTCLFPGSLRAALQFDVFLGYDGVIREGHWFPVVCEIHNDGPEFKAVFELTSGQAGRDQVRRVAVELPTNTRKRLIIPGFGTAGRYATWTARLIDERGKVRAEHTDLRPRKEISWDTPLVGALPRTYSGMPVLPEGRGNRPDQQPEVARLQPHQVPDSPIALEGLTTLYLHPEKALELQPGQIRALLSWLHAGGHLVVALEQPSDWSAVAWLRSLLPVEATGLTTGRSEGEFQDWMQREYRRERSGNLTTPGRVRPSGPDEAIAWKRNSLFEQAEFPIVQCKVLDGSVRLALPGLPLVVTAPRGRGQVTTLLFSPEREPFKSWENRGWLWAAIAQLGELDRTGSPVHQLAQSVDSVFGAMIETRQVRKLPVSWLMGLLLLYLLVIGPLDYFWLKKINRQMLTWLTFPVYVVAFSLLIYWIGFMLRAGETEWNELHVVDVLEQGPGALFKGRSFGALYSPSNARYQLAAEQSIAALRGEFQGSWSGGQESGRAQVEHRGDGFRAEVFVPVWTSQLLVTDWWQPGPPPLPAELSRQDGGWTLSVSNQLGVELREIRLVFEGRVYPVSAVGPGQTTSVSIQPQQGVPLAQFVQEHSGSFQSAIQYRRQAFGSRTHATLDNLPMHSMAASFLSSGPTTGSGGRTPHGVQPAYMSPGGFDLGSLVERGDAVLLAWAEGESLGRNVIQFNPRRGQKNTLLRVHLAVKSAASSQ